MLLQDLVLIDFGLPGGEEGEQQQWLALFYTSKVRSRNQQLKRKFLVYGRQGPFGPLCFLQAICALLQEHGHSCLPTWLKMGARHLLLWEQVKLTEINCSLLSEPSLGSSKPLIDPRVPKQLHQTDSASAIIV